MSGLVPFAFSGQEQDPNGLVYSTDPSLSYNRKRECPTSESLDDRRYHEFTDGQEPDSEIWRIASSPPHAINQLHSELGEISSKRHKKAHLFYSDYLEYEDDMLCDNNEANTSMTQIDLADYLERPRQQAYEIALQKIHTAITDGVSSIDLIDLELRRIPDDIGDLKDLISASTGFEQSWVPNIHIFLTNNLLSKLTPRLFEVTNLTVLSLRNNQLTFVPPGIGKLVNLQDLSLGGNQLKYLPSEILNLKKLQILSLHPNPFLSPSGDGDNRATPPPSQSANIARVKYASSLHLHKSLTDPTVSHAPSLFEYSLKIISSTVFTEGERERWNLDARLDQLVDLAIEQRALGTQCGMCSQPLIVGVGHAMEWWDGVVGNREIAIKRRFCSYKCADQWDTELLN